MSAVIDVHMPYEEDLQRVRSLLSSIVEDALEKETGKRGPLEEGPPKPFEPPSGSD